MAWVAGVDRAEAGRRRQVAAVVVAEVVVAHDGRRLDARPDEEVREHALHLRLTGPETAQRAGL